MSIFPSTFRQLLLVRYCYLLASPISISSSSSLSLVPRHRHLLAGGGASRSNRSAYSFEPYRGPSVAFQPSLPSSRLGSTLSGYRHNLCSIHPSLKSNFREVSPSIVPLIMSRRSSRASSIAAAAKISDAAENAENDNDNSAMSENEDTNSSSKGEAVLKGSESSNDEADNATKKVTKKKKKASPKKKAATKGKAKASTSDDDRGDSEEPKSAKKKAAPKKRKSNKSSTTTSSASDDETSSTTSASKKKQKTNKSPAKKTKKKAADHQRWTERTPLTRHWDAQKAMADNGSYTFTIISWNVAGLRAFVKKQPDALKNLAERYGADVICLQETKLQDGHLDDPKLKLREYFEEKLGGFEGHWSYSLEKKGYSGTAMFIRKRGSSSGGGGGGETSEGSKKGKKQATLGAFFKTAGEDKSDETNGKKEDSTGDVPISHLQPINVDTELGLSAHDGEGRTITAEFPLFYLTNVYVPNSGQKLDRLSYRTNQWDADFLSKMQQLETDGNKPVIWLGDLNVAHNEKDTWNEGAKHLAKSAGTTPEERASFDRQLEAGYVDAFRHLHPEGRGHYSYWSQRAGNREPNKGLRLDYFICSKELLEEGDGRKVCVRDSFMCPEELGSDHCPVVLEIEIKK